MSQELGRLQGPLAPQEVKAREGHAGTMGKVGPAGQDGGASTHWSSLRYTAHNTLTATQSRASSSRRTCGRWWK